ncbi:succinyl-diaminopimelate desuccinylase [Candidatus Symbiobacter mobilis]|uniref:Succinyl-diaminopimelate desuccinylase n=1 Tax=Candidatus Symbiobacter mobilis CR TaxID=946483 RepID=U5N5N8_9BURK|nr:succinyl-diaminopimelate desuccinylase [Candidatus Symbiobacter mobilis]AGX86672.1 succinyl-diaminopimelate desuccinylase [Candidatus Symbiobacter mobilis CR]
MTIELLRQLIACPSQTPDDAGCQALLAVRLSAQGFAVEHHDSGPPQHHVRNLWARRGATANPNAPLFVFAGHTDVVPPGPAEHWISPPFAPTVRDGVLYGRGAADMKGSVAAFVIAVEEFLARYPDAPLSLGVLLTSDEEGPAVDGTVRVVDALQQRGERIDYCIVGEPTSIDTVGDQIKNGRRGSLTAKITVRGTQGHVAYPQLADNPVHRLAPALTELVGTVWDEGNDDFEPTTWQVSNIHAGTGVDNVIPGTVVVDCNFRYGTASSTDSLQSRLQAVLDKHCLRYDIVWTQASQPFLTPRGTLVDTVAAAVLAETGVHTQLSTGGGTSDARFLIRICPQVIELGPRNASIHQVDEHIGVEELQHLKNMYRRVLELLAFPDGAH